MINDPAGPSDQSWQHPGPHNDGEASWSYRHPAHEQHIYLKRAAHLPQEIKDIAGKAQVWLTERYRDLARTGKPQPRVLAAVARELARFIWDIARKTPLKA